MEKNISEIEDQVDVLSVLQSLEDRLVLALASVKP